MTHTYYALEIAITEARVIGVFDDHKTAENHAKWYEKQYPQSGYLYSAMSRTKAQRKYQLTA